MNLHNQEAQQNPRDTHETYCIQTAESQKTLENLEITKRSKIYCEGSRMGSNSLMGIRCSFDGDEMFRNLVNVVATKQCKCTKCH